SPPLLACASKLWGLNPPYEECLCHELTIKGFSFERQKPLAVSYKGIKLDCGSLKLCTLCDFAVKIFCIHTITLTTYECSFFRRDN
ncbi:MAG: GxxExxY protein, partial [Candidatus Scalinduaceae bacterium]